MVNDVVFNQIYSMATLASPPLAGVTLVIFAGVPIPQSISSALIVPPSVIFAIIVAFTSVLPDSQPALDLQET